MIFFLVLADGCYGVNCLPSCGTCKRLPGRVCAMYDNHIKHVKRRRKKTARSILVPAEYYDATWQWITCLEYSVKNLREWSIVASIDVLIRGDGVLFMGLIFIDDTIRTYKAAVRSVPITESVPDREARSVLPQICVRNLPVLVESSSCNQSQ